MFDVEYKEKRVMTRNVYSSHINCIDEAGIRPAKCFDISSLGIGIISDKPIDTGKKLSVEIFTKNNVAVKTASVVRRCAKVAQDWHIGLEFDRMLTAPMAVFI